MAVDVTRISREPSGRVVRTTVARVVPTGVAVAVAMAGEADSATGRWDWDGALGAGGGSWDAEEVVGGSAPRPSRTISGSAAMVMVWSTLTRRERIQNIIKIYVLYGTIIED